ncbi:MAG: hypothetical protein WCA32_23980 [Chromatiaceae bacterium]
MACRRLAAQLSAGDYLFPGRQQRSLHLSARQYARIVEGWIGLLGSDPQGYGTHSLRRTKATLIYRRITLNGSLGILLDAKRAGKLESVTEAVERP